MPAINNLSRVTSLSTSDLLAMYSQSVGNDVAATFTTLIDFIQGELSSSGSLVTQYAAPNATGFSVTIVPTADGTSMFLLLTPAAGYATGTIVLPALAECADGQEVLVTCTQAVTTLTVSGNGSTVNGAPATLAANAFFRLRFDAVLDSWYRVG